MSSAAPVLGILAALVGIADTVPYIRDMLRGRTRPHRGAWFIWGLLAVVVCLAQRADEAGWSLLMTATQAVLTTFIFGLAIRLGVGGLSRSDLLLIGVALSGVAVWIVGDEPVVATLCVIVADLIAAAMMVPKTWRDPGSETWLMYAGAGVGGALAAGAVGSLDASLLAYPVYYCLCNTGLAMVILGRRRMLEHGPVPLPRDLTHPLDPERG